MSSALQKAIKQFLKEIDNFLNSTLRDQALNKPAQKERTKLIESLQKFYNDYSDLKPSLEKSEKRSSDNPRLSSVGSQISEDGCSNEDNIPPTNVSALKGHTKMGYLLQSNPGDGKKLLKQKKDTKKYCVVHENVMYWFLKPTDKSFHGAVFLDVCELEDVSRKQKDFVFQVVVTSRSTRYEFQADNREDFDDWKKAVETGIKCGQQKKAEGDNPYIFDGMSMPATSGSEKSGRGAYVYEMPAEEEDAGEDDSLYEEFPENVSSTDSKFNLTRDKLQSSIPHQRPPSPPKADSDVKLPLPKKGKVAKEAKQANTKKVEKKDAAKPSKISIPKESKTKPWTPSKVANSSPTTKPQTISEVKLKPVPKPATIQTSNDDDMEEDLGSIYDTVGNIVMDDASNDSKTKRPVPEPKPPQLPERNFYVNDPDSDDLLYENFGELQQ